MGSAKSLSALTFAAIAVAWAPRALGTDSPPATDRAAVLKDLTACRSIADSTMRLGCYDKAAARLDQAEASGDVLVVDRAQAQAARRQAFGFNLSALSILNRNATKEEVDNLSATATEAYRNGDGKWVIVLDSGARWRQIDDADLNNPPRQGSKIRIRRASLGSFVMNIDGQPYIRVHRDE